MFHKISLVIMVVMTTNVIGKWQIKSTSLESRNSLGNLVEAFDFWPNGKLTNVRKQQYPTYVVDVPPPEEGAKVARYIVSNSEWASLASTSLLPEIKGYPFADVYSVSDGPVTNSTGVPYLYMTPLDLTAKNVEKDNRCSLSLTLAQGNYCKQKHFDPEDPRCAHVVLTGKIVKVETGSEDETFARNALFSRHPAMKNWPKDHHWYFAKLQIEKICLLDYFGGPKYVSLDDYFHATS